MKVEIIYLDIDGVLNLMPIDALKLITGKTSYPLLGNYDIVESCNKLLERPISYTQFWNKLDRNFWRDITKSPECDEIIDICVQLVGQNNVFLLTAPVIDPDCIAGKVEWIYKYLPRWLHRQFLIGPNKWLCAKYNTLLVDDCDRNIQEFKEAGGQTLLVSRPWNSGNCFSFWLEYLKKGEYEKYL